MKSTDLRITNYVKTFHGIEMVVDVLCDSFNTELHEGLLYENCDGVYMNESILLKCKELKRFAGVTYFSLPNLKAELHIEVYENFIIPIIKSDFGELILDEIRYLHDFQNLYSVLSKKELAIIF